MSGLATWSLGAACTLLSAQYDVAREGNGWEERFALEIAASPGCTDISALLPPGVSLSEAEVTAFLWDDTKVALPASRLTAPPRDWEGAAALRAVVPEIYHGGRLQIRGTLRGGEGAPWTLDPDTTLRPSKDLRRELSLPRKYSEGLTLPARGDLPAAAPPRPSPTGSEVQWGAKRTLDLPDGDPLLRLMPGRGSALHGVEALRWEADSRRDLLLPLPLRRGPLTLEGSFLQEGTAIERDDSLLLLAAPGEADLRVTWSAPDAPAWGTAPRADGALSALEVVAPRGEIAWEAAGWRLTSWDQRPVLPGRVELERALDARFRAAGVMQPGLPLALRDVAPSEELAEALRPALWERVDVSVLPEDPLSPRPLLAARRAGVMSSVEASLALWAMALQAKLRADWLVAYTGDGPAGAVTPAGYDTGLVRVDWGAGPRWIDVGCTVCAPFEVRPWLAGAPSLGAPTPAPVAGAWSVSEENGEVSALFSGPAALTLRLALAEVPPAERATWLAEAVAGTGAKLERAEGLEIAGSPVRIAAKGQSPSDPLDIENEHWTGTRTWSRPGLCEPREQTEPGYHYLRTCEDGRITEVLTHTGPATPDRSLRP